MCRTEGLPLGEGRQRRHPYIGTEARVGAGGVSVILNLSGSTYSWCLLNDILFEVPVQSETAAAVVYFCWSSLSGFQAVARLTFRFIPVCGLYANSGENKK